jgi:DNA replication licensing factor MCM2
MIDQDILRKYIIYARRHCHPRLTEIDREKVTQFYADIRRESSVVGGISIAVRHIESVLRMSEAHAKMHLRDYVRVDDIDTAINMLLESFLQSQKVSVARQLKKKFEPYLTRKTDNNQLLYHTLCKLVNEKAVYEKIVRGVEDLEKVEVKIPIEQFEQEARDVQAHHMTDFLKSSLFVKEFVLEGRYIKATTKI